MARAVEAAGKRRFGASDRDPVFTRNGDIAGQNRGDVGDFLRLFGKPSEFPAGCDLISAANERRLSRGRFAGIGLIQLGNIGVCGFIGGIANSLTIF